MPRNFTGKWPRRGNRSARTNYPVSQNVKRILDERGIRQIEFAEMLGWSRQDTWGFLNDKREIHPTTVLKFMDALGCSADDLFRTDGIEKPKDTKAM